MTRSIRVPDHVAETLERYAEVRDISIGAAADRMYEDARWYQKDIWNDGESEEERQ